VDNHSLQYGNRDNDGLTCFGTIVHRVMVCAGYVDMHRVMNDWGRGYVQSAGGSSGTQKAHVVGCIVFFASVEPPPRGGPWLWVNQYVTRARNSAEPVQPMEGPIVQYQVVSAVDRKSSEASMGSSTARHIRGEHPTLGLPQ
jgi:hypothetical protein